MCAAITLVQSEQSLSIKNDQKQDVLPTKDMEKHSSGQNKNERGDLWVFTLLNISSTWKPDVTALWSYSSVCFPNFYPPFYYGSNESMVNMVWMTAVLLQWHLTLTAKGQLISKAIYGLLTSPKKQMDEFVLLAFLLFTANKSNSSVRFFGESTSCQSAFRF